MIDKRLVAGIREFLAEEVSRVNRRGRQQRLLISVAVAEFRRPRRPERIVVGAIAPRGAGVGTIGEILPCASARNDDLVAQPAATVVNAVRKAVSADV